MKCVKSERLTFIQVGSVYTKLGLKLGFTLFGFIFIAASFFSKALVNISGGFLGVLFLLWLLLCDRHFFKKNNYLKYLLALIGGGVFLSLFSKNAGWTSVISYLNNTKFLLAPFPLAVAVSNRQMLWIGYVVLLVSCLLSICYGWFSNGAIVYGASNGFLPVGRYADQLMVTLLVFLAIFFDAETSKSLNIRGYVFLSVLSGFLFFCLIMTSQRGSWTGFAVSALLLALFNIKRNKKVYIFFLVAVAIILFVGAKFYREVRSIADLKTNASNIVRLQLWSSGLDFSFEEPLFGYGASNIEEEFKQFYYSQPEQYQKKYPKAIQFPGNFHNTYLQIIAESGWIYFILLALYFFWVMKAGMKTLLKGRTPSELPMRVTAIVMPGFLVSQFFHGDLFSYGGVAFIIVLSFGLQALAKKDKKETKCSTY